MREVGVGLKSTSKANGVKASSVGMGVRITRVAAGIGVGVGVPGKKVADGVEVRGGRVEAGRYERGPSKDLTHGTITTAMIPIPAISAKPIAPTPRNDLEAPPFRMTDGRGEVTSI